MKERFPKLIKILDENPETHTMLSQRLFKWLMVLFVGELPTEVEYTVWDLFMAKGSVVIFRVALTVLGLMEQEILKDDDLDNVMMVIMSYSRTKMTRGTLLRNLAGNLHTSEINVLRAEYRKQVIGNL